MIKFDKPLSFQKFHLPFRRAAIMINSMVFLPIRYLCIFFTAHFLFSSNVWAQETLKADILGRVSLAVPKEWAIQDSQSRQRIADLAKEKIGVEGNKSSFTAMSYPAPSIAYIRVTVSDQEDDLSQAQLVSEIRRDRSTLRKELRDTYLKELAPMREKMKEAGLHYTSDIIVDFIPLGGQTAILISYQRPSTSHPGRSMEVSQHHVPLGKKKALITTTNIKGDAEAERIIKQIKSSIIIK